MRRIMTLLLTVLLVWIAAVWLLQRSVLFPRGLANQGAPAHPDPPAGTEVWHHRIEGGTVEAWYLPGYGAVHSAPGPAVVYTHGNGERIDQWGSELEAYRRMGIGVLLPEYRGYGRSAGRPSQKGITDDLAAFVERLAGRPEVDADRIVYHGRSVGAGLLASLSRHRPPAALILESSFTSVAAMARRLLVPRLLVRDPLDVLGALAAYHGPVLVLHGEDDEIIPVAHARAIHDAAPGSTLRLYSMGHNTPPPVERYWADIEAFLKEAAVLP